MESSIDRFARNVADARRQAGLTQEEVSARSGVHPTEVSRIERGERDVRVSTVYRLAEALGTSPGSLLDGDV
jgi:transcriptional regulator with XRE-family HTH domain